MFAQTIYIMYVCRYVCRYVCVYVSRYDMPAYMFMFFTTIAIVFIITYSSDRYMSPL